MLCDKHALNSADFIVVLEVDESAGEGEEGRDVAAAGGDACAVAEDTIVTTAEDNTHTSEDTTSGRSVSKCCFSLWFRAVVTVII